MRLKRL